MKDPGTEALLATIDHLGDYIQDLIRAGDMLRDALEISNSVPNISKSAAALASWAQVKRSGKLP
jgi:hypothetical protein